MISFRYHLVSLVAVFLALAVGIVLGTAALHGPIQADLSSDLRQVTTDKRGLEGEVQDLRAQVGASDAFALAVGPGLLRGSLADRRVLLVTTPQTPGDAVELLTPVLEASGARVAGTLQLLPALSDPASGQLVEDLVAQVVPSGVELPDGSPVERATAELAAALVRPARGPGVEAAQALAVVSAFEEADLVQFSGPTEPLQPATLAVVLDGARPASQQAQQSAVLALASSLDSRSDGAVVAGPAGTAQAGGLVGALRSDAALAREVSSVDNADRGTGRVTVALALAEQLTGRAGQYGAGAGASAALPRPAAP